MICFTIRFETRSCGIIVIASTVCSLRHVRAAICSAIRSQNTLLWDAANNFDDLFYGSSLDGYNRQRQSLCGIEGHSRICDATRLDGAVLRSLSRLGRC